MSCNCRCTGSTSSRGSKGDTGATGSQGLFGGFSGEWLFSTSTAVTPAATFLRLNNATPSSVTEIYVSDTNADSLDYDAFLDSLSNNSKFGYVRLFKKSDSTKYAMYEITAVTDNGTDHTLTVTHIASNSTFAASDNIVLTFSPSVAGITVLNNDTTAVGTTNAGFTTLQTYTAPAATLVTNGDVLEVVACVETNLLNDAKEIRIRLGGTVAHTVATYFSLPRGDKYMTVNLKITRISNTVVYLEYNVVTSSSGGQFTGGYVFSEPTPFFTVAALSTNSLAIDVQGRSLVGTDTITSTQLLVKYLNKA